MSGGFFKNFWEREREEIEKHKGRVGVSILIAVAAIIFAVSDFGEKEEIILTENQPVEENSAAVEVEKVEKTSAPQEISAENVIAVVGANSEILFVKDPFQTSKVAEEILSEVEEVAEEKNNSPPQNISPQAVNPAPKNSAVEDRFILTGTAISDNQRTALVQHYRGKNFFGTIILQVGDNFQGKKVVAITEDAVFLEGGEKILFY